MALLSGMVILKALVARVPAGVSPGTRAALELGLGWLLGLGGATVCVAVWRAGGRMGRTPLWLFALLVAAYLARLAVETAAALA